MYLAVILVQLYLQFVYPLLLLCLYYKEGTVVEEDTQIVSTTVQVLQPDILTVDKASINTVDNC